MRIGFTLPQVGALAHEAGEIARFAREAEGLGAESLWVFDRLLAPVRPVIGYNGADSFPPEFDSLLDPFTVLAVAASATERVSLGTNVLNAPWYPPALLARSLTTIDQVSGGRLIPGFGAGWSPDEFEAVGIPLNERGARLDECLDVLEAIWTTNPAEYHGRYWSLPATRAALKPVQRPRPPIFLAGFAPAAMRRVARRADGWLPAVMPGAGPLDPAGSIAAPMAQIRTLAEEQGRDPGELSMILRVYPLGTAGLDEIAETILRAGEEAGVDHAFVDLMYQAKSVDHALELAGHILALTGGKK
jgi:probable F420-dependent oxidoreductase